MRLADAAAFVLPMVYDMSMPDRQPEKHLSEQSIAELIETVWVLKVEGLKAIQRTDEVLAELTGRVQRLERELAGRTGSGGGVQV